MKDPEFIHLRNKFLLGLVVALIFAIPVLIFVVKSFGIKSSSIMNNLKKDKDMLIYIKSNDCKNCSMVEEVLEDKGVKYFTLNMDRAIDYEEVFEKLSISSDVVETPAIIYVEDGEMVANIMGVKTESVVISLLDDYKLSKEE